jgi:hypothetical protein
MRNLLALFAAALLTFVGVGWHLGWYQVRSVPADEGHRAMHIDIDNNKIGADLKKGEEKVQEALEKNQARSGDKHLDGAKVDLPSMPVPVSNDE